jgi:hypothetical protein
MPTFTQRGEPQEHRPAALKRVMPAIYSSIRIQRVVGHSRLKSGASSPQYGGACGAV